MPREVGDIPDTRAAALGSHHPSRRAVRRRTPTPRRYSSPRIRGRGVVSAPAHSLLLIYFSASYFFSSDLDVRRPVPPTQEMSSEQRTTRRPAKHPRRVSRTPTLNFDSRASTSASDPERADDFQGAPTIPTRAIQLPRHPQARLQARKRQFAFLFGFGLPPSSDMSCLKLIIAASTDDL